MHSESIHRYWICSSRVTSMASWNVRERPDISIPRFRFSKFASVVDDKAVSSFHRWERVMYLPDCPEVSHNFGGLLREPTSMTRVGSQDCLLSEHPTCSLHSFNQPWIVA
jgi:hypothetical protein